MNMRRLLSRIINLLIAVIVLWVWLSMTFRLGRLGSQSEGGFGNLRYFTVLSNLLQGGVSLAYACGIRTGRFKFASTTAITFTFFNRPPFSGAETRLRCGVCRSKFLVTSDRTGTCDGRFSGA